MSTKKLQILDSLVKQAENADTLDGKHANEFAAASDIVGKFTDDGGEIFNDYNNNIAVSNHSTARGYNSFAGQRGFYWILGDIITSTIGSGNLVNITKCYITPSATRDQYTALNADQLQEFKKLLTDGTEFKVSISDVYNSYINGATLTEVNTGTDIKYELTMDEGKTLNPRLSSDKLNYYSFIVWRTDLPRVGLVDLGIGAFASGADSKAQGYGSTAIGNGSVATGMFSYASGLGTVASGERSLAEGSYTEANASSSHSEGWNTVASDSYAHSEGAKTTASGNSSHAEGYQTTASGRCSHSEGRCSEALGSESHAEGYWTKAQGDCQLVIGKYNELDAGDNVHTPNRKGQYIFIAGNGRSESARSNAFTVDWDGNGRFKKSVYANNTERLATENYVINNFSNIGKKFFNTTDNSKFGETFNDYSNNEATGHHSHAEGYNTEASGDYSHAEGSYAVASGKGAHAEGDGNAAQYNTASGAGSHAEGYWTTASGQNAHAEGRVTEASGAKSHVEGWNTIATGDSQHVQGKYNFIDENGSAGNYAHIVGNGTAANKRSNAHTLDWKGNAWFAGNVTVGENEDELATKTYVNTNSGVGKKYIDKNNTLCGEIFNNNNNVASGGNSHAEGIETTAKGENSHAEGYRCYALSTNSHAEGSDTYAGIYRQDENGNFLDYRGDITTDPTKYAVIGIMNHAEGYMTKAYGNYSHAEGQTTTSNGQATHAEGYQTKAEGSFSHAEGAFTKATGQGAHAEGRGNENKYTVASGDTSHAEGFQTTASGQDAHSEGRATTASGAKSHAEGWNTIAAGECQHVQGKYNIVDDTSLYLHIVGNGTADNKRSNAHTIDKNGNAWFAGDVYVGGTGQDNANAKFIPWIEDAECPGCFYRYTSNGEKEWLNPPMTPGIEYRTIERFDKSVVYTQLIQVLPVGIPETGDYEIPHAINNLHKVLRVNAFYDDRKLLPWFDYSSDSFSLVNIVSTTGIILRNKGAYWTSDSGLIEIVLYYTKGGLS